MTRIKQLREAKQLTIRQLEKEIGIPHSMISLIENGKQKLNVEQLFKFAEFFNVSVHFLLGKGVKLDKEFKQLFVESYLIGLNAGDTLPLKEKELLTLMGLVIVEKPNHEDLSLINDLLRTIIVRKRKVSGGKK
jgi:transcriptional regulator with XRE-family HTH domain